MLCLSVDGTVVAVEQENVGQDESCVEDDRDHQPDIQIPQPILFLHPKAEITSYDAAQTEAN